MSKLNASLVTVIGIIMLLPLLNVNVLGTLTTGAIGWVIALIVLAIGVMGLMEK